MKEWKVGDECYIMDKDVQRKGKVVKVNKCDYGEYSVTVEYEVPLLVRTTCGSHNLIEIGEGIL